MLRLRSESNVNEMLKDIRNHTLGEIYVAVPNQTYALLSEQYKEPMIDDPGISVQNED